MAKKYGSHRKMSPKASKAGYGDYGYGGSYYEPFAGYENSTKDQATYWNMVKTQKGVIPTQFMEMPLPMANDIGKKGK